MLEDKLEKYKFGLPTLLISGEQEIYRKIKEEIDNVKHEKENNFIYLRKTDFVFVLVMLENKRTIGRII